jgi:hypothetical protein
MRLKRFLCFFLIFPSVVLFSSMGLAQNRSVPNGQYMGSMLMCDNGYRDVGGQCKKLPPVSNGQYMGSMLMCDNGYRDVGGQCRKLPPVSNGQYMGSMLMCDNGYREVGGQCRKLPSVSNGQYMGSMLMCDNGYREVGGQCHQMASVANGSYLGPTVVCNNGFVFSGEKCVRSNGAASIRNRIDPDAIAQSSRAKERSYAYDSTEYWSGYSAQTSSGTTFDATSGNQYNWRRNYDGSTDVRGLNFRTGSMWNTTIQPDGSMRGFDKNFNPWSYDSSSGTYLNYGSGKMCVGKGAARTCF